MVRKPEGTRIKVLSLGELLLQVDMQKDNHRLTTLLSSFSCSKDKDIENFLHNRAIDFERANKSRTYILCVDEILRKEGRVVILGYFSVALKVLDLPEELSNRSRKTLDGLSAKLHGEKIKSIPCYLIGQLAKNSSVPKELSVRGEELINSAISVIHAAETIVGGRYVLVECRNDSKLLQFYKDNDFEVFGEKPFEDAPMVQMLRTLCSTAI